MTHSKILCYGKQSLDENDIEAVVKVLRSDWLTQGPVVEQFESAFREKFDCRFAVAVSNGTAALHLTALGLSWSAGDVVITSPLTFLATANAILYTGATPDFVDIDPQTYTLDLEKLESKIKALISKRHSVKAVIGVDFAGHPCDWNGLQNLAKKYDLQLIDDACHALSAKIENTKLCSAEFANAVVCSFHPVKHVTTGEGGVVFTNDESLAVKIKRLRSHGITKEPAELQKNDGPWYYEMHELGFNYRLTDLQSALGISQLQKLECFQKRREEIAKDYNNFFAEDDRFVVPTCKTSFRHGYHLYPLQVKFDRLKISKADFFRKLEEKGIRLQVHYVPIHLQPFYARRFGFKPGDFPVVERFYRNVISIPIYPSLTDSEVDYVQQPIIEALSDAGPEKITKAGTPQKAVAVT